MDQIELFILLQGIITFGYLKLYICIQIELLMFHRNT